jgi:antitoxin PrlF
MVKLEGMVMTEKETNESCCSPENASLGCCKVEAIVGIDERGQMVLPKELRDKINIRAGDKLAVVSMQKGGETCCLTLIKADEFAEMVKGMLGPMLEEVFNTKG